MALFPKAGEHQQKLGAQHWSLAPLPIPTNYPAIPQQIDIKNANNTSLDYGNTDF